MSSRSRTNSVILIVVIFAAAIAGIAALVRWSKGSSDTVTAAVNQAAGSYANQVSAAATAATPAALPTFVFATPTAAVYGLDPRWLDPKWLDKIQVDRRLYVYAGRWLACDEIDGNNYRPAGDTREETADLAQWQQLGIQQDAVKEVCACLSSDCSWLPKS